MTKSELVEFLKENLTLEVRTESFDFDKMRITVKVKVADEEITEDSDWFNLPQP